MGPFDRTSIATALGGLRVPELVLALRRTSSPWITALTYHRVAPAGVASTMDDGVVDATPEQLDRQLAFVRRWFDVIALGDLLAYAAGRAPLPRNPLLVTFDDGYREGHDVVLPILLRHRIRATFFVTTDCVERRCLFWWDYIAHVIKASRRTRIVVEYPERVELALATPQARSASIGRVQRIVKDRPGLDLPRLLEELRGAAGVELTQDGERRLAEDAVLRWEHVLALRRAGMDVQSQTCSHRVLQTLGEAEVARELRVSRETLEDVLGEPVRAVSYPFGRPLRGAPQIKRQVREAGYDMGFSDGTGINRRRSFDPFDARRIAMDAALSDRRFRSMLAVPWLFE
jgi:peptidoglycan/xylan/chitin deacetylase (PgdA/CDA1 family)